MCGRTVDASIALAVCVCVCTAVVWDWFYVKLLYMSIISILKLQLLRAGV
jgi:hypothetical protein